jgi:hypothetical protein
LRLSISFRADRFGDFQKGLQLEGGLRNDERRVQRRQFRNFAGVTDNERIRGRVTDNADHFGMVRTAGDYNVAAFLGGALSQTLHASHEWAGRVHYQGGALLELDLDQGRHAVRANDGYFVLAHLASRFDGGHAFAFQASHFLRVVNQRAQSAYRRANFQRVLNHFDGALDAKTKSEFVC